MGKSTTKQTKTDKIVSVAKSDAGLKAKSTPSAKKAAPSAPKVDPNAFDIELATKMIEALKKSDAIQSEGLATNLFADSQGKSVTFEFTLNAIPEKSRWTHQAVELPYPIYSAPRETCILTRNPQRQYKDFLIENPVPGVTKVIGIEKLRKKYGTDQAKRDLCNAFDLFLCDRQLISLMPDALGSAFFKRNKMPYALKYNNATFISSLQQSLKCTFYRIPRGSCLSVKIGHLSMETEQLVQNAAAVFADVLKFFSESSSDEVAKKLVVVKGALKSTDVLAPLNVYLNKSFLLDGVTKSIETSKALAAEKKAAAEQLAEERAKKQADIDAKRAAVEAKIVEKIAEKIAKNAPRKDKFKKKIGEFIAAKKATKEAKEAEERRKKAEAAKAKELVQEKKTNKKTAAPVAKEAEKKPSAAPAAGKKVAKK